jgi:hypothetical protein
MHLVDLKGPCCKPGCEDEEDESNRQRQLVGCPRVRSPSPSLLLPLFIQGSKEAFGGSCQGSAIAGFGKATSSSFLLLVSPSVTIHAGPARRTWDSESGACGNSGAGRWWKSASSVRTYVGCDPAASPLVSNIRRGSVNQRVSQHRRVWST